MKLTKEIRKKNYSKLLNAITVNEFLNTMDEGWAYKNDSFEAEMFKNFNNEQKEVYALVHAKQFAIDTMKLSDEDFYSSVGNMFDEVID